MSKIKVNNPATGEIIEEVKVNTEEEVELALENASTAFDSWKK